MLSTTKLKANYKIGDEVQARVIERIDAQDWIVSLNGTLIRITNQVGTPLRENQLIWLKVKSLDPAELILI